MFESVLPTDGAWVDSQDPPLEVATFPTDMEVVPLWTGWYVFCGRDASGFEGSTTMGTLTELAHCADHMEKNVNETFKEAVQL